MGSHSVTCHPTQVNAPRLTPAMQAGTRFTYPGGIEGWVDLVGPESNQQPFDHESDAEPLHHQDNEHQAHYKWDNPEHHWLLTSLWKGQVRLVEVLRTPRPFDPRGRPPPVIKLIAAALRPPSDLWTPKKHFAESENRRAGSPVPELRGPDGMEEGKRQGYLATRHQYCNAIGIRHQGEEKHSQAYRPVGCC